jgi:hypothetical protein
VSLDLTRVAGQVIAMISALRDNRAEQQRRLQFALKTLGNPAIDLDDLKKKFFTPRPRRLYCPGYRRLSHRCRPASIDPLLPDKHRFGGYQLRSPS